MVTQSSRSFVRDLYYRLLRRFSRREIEQQINTKSGELMDAINERSARFARPTENFEIFEALHLSDFYFPHNETEICFAIRRDSNPYNIGTFDDLVENLEDATHIDCSISAQDRSISFQLKRYPQEYLEHTNEAFLEWFRNKVLAHYGNMNGTILIITPQPSRPFNQSGFDFLELSDSLVTMRDDITFDEIAITFNDANRYFILQKLFPEQRRLAIPVNWALRRFRGEI